ncbi:MAG: helix-turn-helix domain-containing protein, partial [Pyrobaculum sp.]
MKRIETVLNNLGIGSKEVNIYITLVEKGALTARELSEILKIPYTKIYIYLKKLENIGLVEIDTRERPVKFRAA